jgi:hypothetical protein
MNRLKAKFARVPSFRNASIALVGAGSALLASSSFAADMASGANTSIAAAQASGESVGGTVVACVAALCVVGVIISLVRKV